MFGRKKGFSSARIDTLIGQGTVIKGDLVFLVDYTLMEPSREV